MTSEINRFGELFTKWQSHKHPDNPNFMQVVNWFVWEKDGKTTVCWNLGSGSQTHYLHGMTKDEVIAKFTDVEIEDVEITEEYYQNWLKSKI